jgi:membrane fusion protein (multidrug efflux system)
MNIRRRNLILLGFVNFLAITVLFSCKNSKEDATVKTRGMSKGLRAEGYVVKAESFQKDFSASGTLRPNEEVEIHPEVSGRITAISFTEGSNVRKGQTLVQINDADIRAQIQKLRAQRALQQKMLDRQEELLRIGGISRQEYETTQTQIASINADIAFQEAALRKTRIVTPFDGRIGLRQVSVGAIVSPTTVVASLQQVHQLKMDFSIPDQFRDALTVGKQVFFTIDGSSEPLTGKISAIEPGASVNTRAINVRATVANPGGKLSPGSFAHVQIPFESNNTAILIPSQAVIPTSRNKQVAIVRNGKADLVAVELGTRTESMTEILGGLVVGDTVITTGLMQVKPGMDVKILKVKS